MIKYFLDMNFNILKFKKRATRKLVPDYKQELLVKQGREQFKALLKRGLSVPIALL